MKAIDETIPFGSSYFNEALNGVIYGIASLIFLWVIVAVFIAIHDLFVECPQTVPPRRRSNPEWEFKYRKISYGIGGLICTVIISAVFAYGNLWGEEENFSNTLKFYWKFTCVFGFFSIAILKGLLSGKKIFRG